MIVDYTEMRLLFVHVEFEIVSNFSYFLFSIVCKSHPSTCFIQYDDEKHLTQ